MTFIDRFAYGTKEAWLIKFDMNQTLVKYTVVKRTRVPAGYLVKMATDAASLRPGLCELWRP